MVTTVRQRSIAIPLITLKPWGFNTEGSLMFINGSGNENKTERTWKVTGEFVIHIGHAPET